MKGKHDLDANHCRDCRDPKQETRNMLGMQVRQTGLCNSLSFETRERACHLPVVERIGFCQYLAPQLPTQWITVLSPDIYIYVLIYVYTAYIVRTQEPTIWGTGLLGNDLGALVRATHRVAGILDAYNTQPLLASEDPPI